MAKQKPQRKPNRTERTQALDKMWRPLARIGANLEGLQQMGFVVPRSVVEFIGAYLEGRDIASALDPAAGVGALLTPLVSALQIPAGVGLSVNRDQLSIARKESEGLPIEWVSGAPRATLKKLGRFDLVISSPPLNLPSVTETLVVDDTEIEVRDSETHVLAIEASTHLSPAGEAIFILPTSFFLSARSARLTLQSFGLHIHSVVSLPAGTFAPVTSIELQLVFVGREATDRLFAGSLSPSRDPSALVENLKARKEGQVPELGRLVRLEDYRGGHALVAAEEEKRLAARSGLTGVPLRDVVQAVNLAARQTGEYEAFANLPNCVYLPLIGSSPAVSSLSDLRIKPQNYAQLVVNPEKAYASFLADFFNSELGRKVRDGLLSGSIVPKITKQALLGSTVYLLPLEQQEKVVGVSRDITSLRLRLEQLHQQLWNRPGEAGRVRKELRAVNQKESVEAWIEMLPFPLASILQRYTASLSPEHKTAHLLNFFEAATQFFGTLMTSAFYSDQEFFQAHRHEWFEGGKDNPHTLARSSFGEWVVRCQRLAKATRKMMSGEKAEQDRCLGLYRVSDRERIAALADKKLYAVLDTVSRYRNDWKGHTGVISRKEYGRRLMVLQDQLDRVRAILGTTFDDWWLVRPGRNVYMAGLYTYDVQRLMGSHQIFREENIDTSVAMDSNELFFIDTATREPLQMLHFFRMMPVAESEEIACYFFSKLQKEGARWVSYHFEGKAERVERDPAVLKVIADVEDESQ